uniref:Glutathione Stransferase putative n=1 Tax=Albugo laibachii Nc14 TaxID=890382 RepID=F0W3K9_9STRA|nr:glutathione Stransferase putative [Albugo laibachii Nc14]CCA16286.1 glutathione Stransferase putative [Albugo laibachii Nc14]|eukprot:CCA16286.1 glutathione Stransferase putative [Albugo laibachii Nc14]
MSTIKLTYFDAEARAALIRICFAYGKVPFEDKRLTPQEFGALKPTLPLGQVPVMHIDNATYSQSMAMARYAANLSGIYPTDALQVLRVESILGCYDEIVNAVVEILFFIPDEAAKAAKTSELTEKKVPQVFSYVEGLVSGKFVLGDKISVADIAILCMVDYYLVAMKGFDVSKYSKIASVIKNVKAEPSIAAYFSK